MSKRDRANRFADSPEFQEHPQIGRENPAMRDVSKTTAPQKSIPTIVENTEEEDRTSVLKKFQKIGTFFANLWEKFIAFSVTMTKTVFVKPWGWYRSVAGRSWQILQKIPSYCVIRWDSDETDKGSPKSIVDPKEKTTIKGEPVKTEVKSANPKPSSITVVDQFDEEDIGSHWWSLGIKVAAATTALFILGGGYFIVKPMLFPVTTSDIETVAVTDQTLPERDKESAPNTNTVTAASVMHQVSSSVNKIPKPAATPAAASPTIAQSVPTAKQPLAFPESPKEPKQDTAVSQANLEPAQESPLPDDFFASAPSPAGESSPAIAENTTTDNETSPPVNDLFGAAQPNVFTELPKSVLPESIPTELAPAVPQSTPSNNTTEQTAALKAEPIEEVDNNAARLNTAVKPLAALEPLAPLETTKAISPQIQLQPLEAIDTSTQSQASAAQSASVPIAAQSTVNAPIASNFRDRRNQRRMNSNPSFDQAPSPPSIVSSISDTSPNPMPTKAEESLAEPVKEIIPQIPHSGMVENVPPAAVQQISAPPIAEAASVQMMSSESAPAIPKDAPLKSDNIVSVPPIAESEIIDESVLPFLPLNESPIDQPLRERLREQRNDEEAEPAKLRFTAKAAVQEPALRFTPKHASIASSTPSTNENSAHAVQESNILQESVKQFRDMLPTATTNTLNPDSTDIEIALPVLENAPAPTFAEVKPAYRTGQGTGEKGMTFQSRIDSEITRSPAATETYIIQQGDTYLTISERFYGTSLLYTALAAHNQKSSIGWRPAEGVVIEIPTAEYLRANYRDVSRHRERRLKEAGPAIRYIVQAGDTVFQLATDKLQDSRRWKEIHALNSDRIQDVRAALTPGMEILLPAETMR